MGSTIGPGCVGDPVKRVQRALARQHIWQPFGPITGVFDTELATGIKRFQRLHGLPDTGIVDRSTWTVLPHYMAASPTLRLGDSGPVVAALQRTLSGRDVEIFTPYTGAIDGVFGRRTEAAVFALQTWFGMRADGAVSEDTWFICLTPGTARQLTLEAACGLTRGLI